MNIRISSLILIFGLAFTLHVQAANTTDMAEKIGALRYRALQAADVGQADSLYMSAKAQAWLDFAFEEYIERDNTGLIEDALQRAQQLTAWLENKQPEAVAEPREIRGTIRIREDLWAAHASARHHSQGYPCTAPFLGRAEVQLFWAGHEQAELGNRHAQRYINEAVQLLKDAERIAQDCPQEKVAQRAVAIEVASKLTETSTNLAVARLPESVHFAYDKADISPATDSVLRGLSDTLRAYPWLRLELTGHTDRIGSEAYNLKLSQRRAESVKQRLVELGLPEDRFISRGLGKSRLLMQPDGLDARARDRRVQFAITNDIDPAGSATRIETQPQESDLQPGEKGRNPQRKTDRSAYTRD